MGQLGFQEIFLIFLIALLVFGPRKLPELGKSLGKGLREFKRATEDLKSSWEDQMRDVEEPFKEATKDIHKDLEETARDINAGLDTTHPPKPESSQESTQPAETAPKEKV
jgi:TatA/E family protein of Tat protein translocase